MGATKKDIFDPQATFDHLVKMARDMYPEETRNVTFAIMKDEEKSPTIIDWIKSNYPSARDDREFLHKQYKVYQEHEGSFVCYDKETQNVMLCFKPDNFASNFVFDDPEEAMLFTFWHELGHIVDPKMYAPHPMFITFEESDTRTNALEVTADIFSCLHGLRQQFLKADNVKRLAVYRETRAIMNKEMDHYTTEALFNLSYNTPENITSLTPQEIKAIAVQHANAFPLKYKETQQKLSTLLEEYKKEYQKKNGNTP